MAALKWVIYFRIGERVRVKFEGSCSLSVRIRDRVNVVTCKSRLPRLTPLLRGYIGCSVLADGERQD